MITEVTEHNQSSLSDAGCQGLSVTVYSCTVQYNTEQCIAVHCSALQCSTVNDNMLYAVWTTYISDDRRHII